MIADAVKAIGMQALMCTAAIGCIGVFEAAVLQL
jgi:hypothetical protein